MVRYKIAEVVFDAQTKYNYAKKVCKDYEYFGNEEPKFTAIITDEDVAYERNLAEEQEFSYHDAYLESLALFRKLCNYLLDCGDGIVFHSSAVAVDGEAYLFTAPSGTGKSTHARLWRELLGDRAVMVNDDKPIIRYKDGDFYVYGTPWRGKHGLGENISAKVKAICKIHQAEDNRIERASTKEMLFTILAQTVRPKELSRMTNLIDLVEKMLKKIDKYCLGCNMDISAAELSYSVMSKGNKNEN